MIEAQEKQQIIPFENLEPADFLAFPFERLIFFSSTHRLIDILLQPSIFDII